MIVRPFAIEDALEVSQLFYDTVHHINAKDYTKEQLHVWAADPLSLTKSSRPLQNSHAYVAVLKNQIVGFADLSQEGELDRLYVHHAFQGQGIASKLVKTIEEKALSLGFKSITLESSITAKPFFESKNYTVIEQQKKLAKGIYFTVYKMIKKL